tara:strand:- start:891 stop:1130 length:240 start_codon:yes stop_codon:yes gene_type:complete
MLKLSTHLKLKIKEKNMKNDEVSKAIAYLADKVSKFHSELLAVKRDHVRHTEKCSCQSTPGEKVNISNNNKDKFNLNST